MDSYIGAGAPRFFLALNPELPDPAFAKLVIRTADEGGRVPALRLAFYAMPPSQRPLSRLARLGTAEGHLCGKPRKPAE